ncbi:sensor histidine kinase [Gemmatimonas sp.]|jgi:signal transduction histidine kinase|uniref:sensor histidine kinase n=1 Tax=Gemmatimonas sp. TaxID=1962908 RepID=UPI0037BF447B
MSLSTDAATSEPLVRFARKLSHDLNNFSTVIRTYSELLLSDLPAGSATHADVAEIQRAAENMVQYLQRVTRFARAGSIKRVPIDVDAATLDAVAEFGGAAPQRVVEARVLSGVTLQADSLWWQDIVGELLRNAHEASPVGRSIVLTQSREQETLVLSVEDEGAGFAEPLATNAAEPLVTSKTGVRGAGMGLALVGAFVGTFGGTLAQTHEGGRTVVSLRLPVG